MPLNPLSVSILCLVAASLGMVCARWVLERRHRAACARLEEDMTAKVRSRYEAYLTLEAQVMRIFKRLDEIESETQRSLATSTARLRTLDRAMAAHEGGREQHSKQDANGLGWMSEYLEESSKTAAGKGTTEVVAVETATTKDASGDADVISVWEGKLERLRSEKHAEIERQSAVIAELTERLNGLSPKSDMTKRLEKEMLLWQDKHQRMERENAAEIAGLRAQVELGRETSRQLAECEQRLEQLAAELERTTGEKDALIAELESRVAELEPNVAELERVRAEVAEWQSRCEREIERRESETAELAERIAELEPMESTIEFLWEDKAGLERTISGKDRELEAAATLRQQQMLELTATRESLGDLEASHHELTQRYASEVLGLNARIQELEPKCVELDEATARIGELEQELEAGRACQAQIQQELSDARSRIEDLDATCARWESGAQESERTLADWRERYETLESERESEVHGLREQIAALQPLVARVENFERLVGELETAERAGRQRIAELEVEGRRLARELESRTVKHDRTAERLADVERSLVESTQRLRRAEEQHAAELHELQERLQGYANQLASAQQAQSELAGRNREQEVELHELRNQLSDSRARTGELERRLSNLDQEAQGKSRRITHLMAELDVKSAESERVRREADRKRSLVEAAESVLAELRPKLQALEAQLHEKDGADSDSN